MSWMGCSSLTMEGTLHAGRAASRSFQIARSTHSGSALRALRCVTGSQEARIINLIRHQQ